MDAEYLRVLSDGKACVSSSTPLIHRVDPVDGRTACIVAAEAMKQVRMGRAATSGMPAGHADKITDVFVTEMHTEHVEPGTLWGGFWYANIVPSGQKLPFVVTFDRDDRTISMGFCRECIDSRTSPSVDSVVDNTRESDTTGHDMKHADTASRSKRGVAR